ncbi:MAG: hypothetical protein FWC26_10495 [Fibromonadales bacterium]|nr:hypothetical protein [Fibromonadales bacterium]
MKKTLFAIFAVCLLLIGLFGCDGEPPEPYGNYAWANKSGLDVKMIVVKDYPDKSKSTHEKFIANGDTLRGSSYEEWHPYSGSLDIANKVKLIFLDELKKCLIFDGEIENYSFDIRFREGTCFNSPCEFVYTITPEHRAMAKEEDCQSSD